MSFGSPVAPSKPTTAPCVTSSLIGSPCTDPTRRLDTTRSSTSASVRWNSFARCWGLFSKAARKRWPPELKPSLRWTRGSRKCFLASPSTLIALAGTLTRMAITRSSGPIMLTGQSRISLDQDQQLLTIIQVLVRDFKNQVGRYRGEIPQNHQPPR